MTYLDAFLYSAMHTRNKEAAEPLASPDNQDGQEMGDIEMIHANSIRMLMITAAAMLTLGFVAQDVHGNEIEKKHNVSTATPGDVKTSNDDSGMNHDDATHEKISDGGDDTPGDVKTSNDDSGMNHDDATHEKVLENGEPATKH